MSEKLRTERITNIDELEAIHKSIYMDASNLKQELEKENPNMLYIKTLAKSLHMHAHQADDFEFYIEQRTVNAVSES